MNAKCTIEDNLVAQPFVKWVGGKRGLLSQMMEYIPEEFNNYFEPFVGGGALFFELYSRGRLKGKNVYLFDINEELINTYNIVKNNPDHSKEFYYEIRLWDRQEGFKNKTNIEKAARFIYLNRTCFNGLYRVNKKNQNNVPMGNYKNPKICNEKVIYGASKALQDITILNASYKEVLEYAKKDDLVYFDPPYYPLEGSPSFTSYSEFDFLDKEQEELFDTFLSLDKKGCNILHSNSHTEYIKELYKEYEIKEIMANRMINSKSNDRGKIKEILIRNQ